MGRSGILVSTIASFALAACGGSSKKDETETVLYTQQPYAAPVNILDGTGTDSCSIYLEEKCEAGTQRVCSVYDPALSDFVEPDPMFRRGLLYDRYYDLYQSPDGQTASRHFVDGHPGGTSEDIWGADDAFDSYGGLGDSAIWTGTALNGIILRYLETGTAADYARMEQKVRDLLTMWEVTQIPGYLARYHFMDMATGAPKAVDHHLLYDSPWQNWGGSHTYYVADSPETVPGLPADYFTGIDDGTGTLWQGTIMWNGHPSIDQYSGSTTSLPAAWGLLKDQDLKDRIARQLICYLNRLERVDMINVQSNPAAVGAIESFLANGDIKISAGEPDLRKLDTLTMYYLRQPSSENLDTFNFGCPSKPVTKPAEVIDAKGSIFEAEVLDLIGRYTGVEEAPLDDGIDHFYAPNARGQDAVHMMYLAAIAYHFTGDEVYRAFFDETLVGEMDALNVAKTWIAVVLPRWCRKYYEAHISTAPLWGFINLLDAKSPVKAAMQAVMHEDAWKGDNVTLGNSKYAFMFAGSVPAGVGTGQAEATAEGLDFLGQFGGNDGVIDDPRRSYPLVYDDVLAQLPSGIEAQCPTEEEVATCNDDPVIFGFPAEVTPDITFACQGASDECQVDGLCTQHRATKALPIQLRPWSGFLWQRNPFQMSASNADDGTRQSPGVDFLESFWLARHYDFITEGKGQALAWKDTGTSCP